MNAKPLVAISQGGEYSRHTLMAFAKSGSFRENASMVSQPLYWMAASAAKVSFHGTCPSPGVPLVVFTDVNVGQSPGNCIRASYGASLLCWHDGIKHRFYMDGWQRLPAASVAPCIAEVTLKTIERLHASVMRLLLHNHLLHVMSPLHLFLHQRGTPANMALQIKGPHSILDLHIISPR